MDSLLALPLDISTNLSRAMDYPKSIFCVRIPKDVVVYRVLGIEGLYISQYNFYAGKKIDEELVFYFYSNRNFWFSGHIPLKILQDSDKYYLISYFKMRYRQMYRKYQNR